MQLKLVTKNRTVWTVKLIIACMFLKCFLVITSLSRSPILKKKWLLVIIHSTQIHILQIYLQAASWHTAYHSISTLPFFLLGRGKLLVWIFSSNNSISLFYYKAIGRSLYYVWFTGVLGRRKWKGLYVNK